MQKRIRTVCSSCFTQRDRPMYACLMNASARASPGVSCSLLTFQSALTRVSASDALVAVVNKNARSFAFTAGNRGVAASLSLSSSRAMNLAKLFAASRGRGFFSFSFEISWNVKLI